MATRKGKRSRPVAGIQDTKIHTWFERDRAHVELRDARTDETLVEWWDEDVSQAVEDGFLRPRDWHGSAYEYWESMMRPRPKKNPRRNPRLHQADNEEFVRAYLATAEWSSTDDDGEPLDRLGLEWSEEAKKQAARECKDFLESYPYLLDCTRRELSQAGHDFWLTRNRHGAGFGDGDWEEPMATELTDASHRAGERDVYVGDDDLLYFSPGN